jgi:hypothetical protein
VKTPEKNISESWNGYIELTHARLYVKGIAHYGKNERFFSEFKQIFFNKNLLQLKQKDISRDIKEKTIFDYLISIQKTNELIFIKFQPKESQTHKSRLNLLSEPMPQDASRLYDLVFEDIYAHATNKSSHIRMEIPNGLEKSVENFYLFSLKNKNETLPDRYLWDKFSIKITRNRDLIMGVLIRKASTLKTTITKRHIQEEFDYGTKKQRTNNETTSNISPSQSNKASSISKIRDPRILKQIERENEKNKKASESQKETNSTSPLVLSSLKPKKRVSIDQAESNDSEDKENQSSSKKIKL